MKKLVITGFLLSSMVFGALAQDNANNFDKKFRFGIRIAPQPTWIKSKDKNATGSGIGLGFGFGLITEFKLSDIIHFYTGIGGDFENGTITYKNDPSNQFSVTYFTDRDGALVELTNEMDTASLFSQNNMGYQAVTKRKIKTTYVTIPLTLKMMTQEYSGFRYFAQFGADLGIRTKIKADDEYSILIKRGVPTLLSGTNTNSELDLQKDASLIPIRIGLNVGLGTEYRIAGTTSLMFSINYFSSFTNLMRSTSKYAATDYQVSNGKVNFTYLKQNLIQNAIRINIGILF